MLLMYIGHFDLYLFMMQKFMSFWDKFQLPLLCILGGAGMGIYWYGARKLARLHARQREEMRLHPDEPAVPVPEKARQSALAFQIAGFIVLLAACLGMLLLGHFDKYLALLGVGG